jgi:hypothetical protein
MMLVQEDARSNYKVEYAVALQAGVVLPKVAPATVGAAPVSPDSKFLQMAPASLATAYVDVLMKDTASEFYGQFDVATDAFIAASGLAAKTKRITELSSTAEETIDNAVGVGEPIDLGFRCRGCRADHRNRYCKARERRRRCQALGRDQGASR